MLVKAVLAVIAWLAVTGVNIPPKDSSQAFPHLMPAPTFVGANACGQCHNDELKLWTGSHHQLAMQPATDATVLGDFNNSSFTHDGIVSTFSRSAGRFMVRTDGPDGRLHEYEVKFAFGVYPLQQYLIPMPGGRLQALGIAWDCRPRGEGGQRWFFLYPGQRVSTREPLHWSGIDQNWNYMCADCHSTNVRKNYDPRSRSFSTSWSDVDAACEACHGPGSNHVAWAKKSGDWRRFDDTKGLTIALDERRGVSWSSSNGSGKVRRSRPRQSQRETQMCARCHSRRSQIHEDYVHGQPAGDDYRVALLDPDAYFPDGQIKGEDYEYGSFVQSRMFAAGVTCSDCHEPHSSKLRGQGNSVCLQCHAASKYDSPSHHFHKAGSRAAQCVACHMPTRTYMVVHVRHDHSLRIPSPDTAESGTPDACAQCHTDKPRKWASESIARWYGHVPQGFQTYGPVFESALLGEPRASQSLARLALDRDQPAIARATAVSALAAYRPGKEIVRSGVSDLSDLVRRAAAASLTDSNSAADDSLLMPLLSDPVRAVRIEAAETLAGLKQDRLPTSVAAALRRATTEYVAAQELNADRPEAHLNLGLLYQRTRRPRDSEAEFKTALSLDPSFAPAAVNLADLYREEKRDADGERVLRGAIAGLPDDASLEHALGLLLVRQKRLAEALGPLAAAARIAPDIARYSYVYAIALNETGHSDAAIETLKHEVDKNCYDRDSLEALTTFLHNRGKDSEATAYVRRLQELDHLPP